MKTTQDYLTNILLITLILFLVYILYRRLLVMLGKDETVQQFVHFSDAQIRMQEGAWLVELEVPADCEVDVAICNKSGEELHVVHRGLLDAGDHTLQVNAALEPGEYVCAFKTDNQRAERYFSVT